VDRACYSSVKFESRHPTLTLETHILIQYRVVVNAPRSSQTSRCVSRSVRLGVEHLLGVMTRFWSIQQSLEFRRLPRTQYIKPSAKIRKFDAEDVFELLYRMMQRGRSTSLFKFWGKALLKKLSPSPRRGPLTVL